jgi:hypothetical protein
VKSKFSLEEEEQKKDEKPGKHMENLQLPVS